MLQQQSTPSLSASSQLLTPTASVSLLTSSTHLSGLHFGCKLGHPRLTWIVHCPECIQHGHAIHIIICLSDDGLHLVVSWYQIVEQITEGQLYRLVVICLINYCFYCTLFRNINPFHTEFHQELHCKYYLAELSHWGTYNLFSSPFLGCPYHNSNKCSIRNPLRNVNMMYN